MQRQQRWCLCVFGDSGEAVAYVETTASMKQHQRVFSCSTGFRGRRNDAEHEMTPALVSFRAQHHSMRRRDTEHAKTPTLGNLRVCGLAVNVEAIPNMKGNQGGGS